MKHLIIISTIILALIGCKEEDNCLDYSSNSGLIIMEQNMGECYSIMSEDEYLITCDSAYKKLPETTYDSIQETLGCGGNPDRPTINFDDYYLLGAKTIAQGCLVTYDRDVQYDSITKELEYTVNVHQCGNCADRRYHMNWVLIKHDTIFQNISYKVQINYYIESN